MKKIYTIDGNNFNTIESFYEEVSRVLIPDAGWGHNLDAFDDILYGGFGTPDEGFVLIWKNVKKSQEDLGYKETYKWFEKKTVKEHASPDWLKKMELAKANQGETLFMILVDIIKGHSPHVELKFE